MAAIKLHTAEKRSCVSVSHQQNNWHLVGGSIFVWALDHPDTQEVAVTASALLPRLHCVVFLFSCLFNETDTTMQICWHAANLTSSDQVICSAAVPWLLPISDFQKFQDIEESHILHMKEIIRSYAQSVDETHIQIGEVSVCTHTYTLTFLWVE